MKKLYTFITAMFFAFLVKAQNPVPNPSFETWNGNDPVSWTNSSDVTQSTDAHTGTYAVKGEYGSGSPFLSVGTGNGMNTNTRWAYVNLYYKFVKTGNASISVSVYFDNPNYTIGQASSTITTASATYKALSIPVSYNLSGNPTSCTIDISITNGSAGSYFIIDDVSLTVVPLGVAEIEKESSTLHVFPNPATNLVQVNFKNERQKPTVLQVLNMLGQTMMELNTITNTASLDVSSLSAGNYIVAVKNEEAILTKQLTIK